MTLDSFYAADVQKAVQNPGEQEVRLAAISAARCNSHWIELNASPGPVHRRLAPRTNINYLRATGARLGDYPFVNFCQEIMWHD